jgi:hypothetical protein
MGIAEALALIAELAVLVRGAVAAGKTTIEIRGIGSRLADVVEKMKDGAD